MAERGHYYSSLDDKFPPGKIICVQETQEKYRLLKRLSSDSSPFISFKVELLHDSDDDQQGRFLHDSDDDQQGRLPLSSWLQEPPTFSIWPQEPPSSSRNNNNKKYMVLKLIPERHYLSRKLRLEHEGSYRPEDHHNILGVNEWLCTHEDGYVGVEIPFMNEGSLRHIVSTMFNNGGLPEDCIAVALRETLLGLSFLHSKGRVHKHFSAANIFVNGGGPNNNNTTTTTSIKLAFEASMYEDDGPGGSSSSTSALDLKQITIWGAAPEVYGTGGKPCGQKADIWLVGITALELAYGGCLPVADRGDLEAIIKNITKKEELLSLQKFTDAKFISKGKKMKMYLQKKVTKAWRKIAGGPKVKEQPVLSKNFENMLSMCLAEDPDKRATADELLQTNFFRNSKGMSYFYEVLLSAKERLTEEEGRN